MLIIDKLDNGTGFSVKDGDDSIILYKEAFSPTVIGNEVTIRSQLRGVKHRAPFNEVVVDGETFESAADVHYALSYLTSFKRGGGSSPSPTPVYQNKSLTITQNGQTTIRPDSEYDALSRVNVRVDVAEADVSRSVMFVDYDGTLLYSYAIEEAQNLTAMPELPSGELVYGEAWTHTLEEVRATDHMLYVGAMCRTHSGKTIVDGEVTEDTGYALPVCIAVNGMATIRVDWGNGEYTDISATSTLTAPYSSPQKYRITVERIEGDGTYSLGRGSSTTSFIGAGNAKYRTTVTNMWVGDNVASALSYAFNGNYALTTISIPQGVGLNSIPSGHRLLAFIFPRGVDSLPSGFRYAFSLKVAVLPNAATGELPAYALGDCSSLLACVIPDGVAAISSNAFAGCGALQAVHIPRSVTSVGGSAFSACRTIKEITLPPDVAGGLGSTFNGCHSLQKVNIPQGVTEIGGATFESCRQLTSIAIPSSVTSFTGQAPFRDCASLREVIFEGKTPPTFANAPFTNIQPSLLKIYAPDESVEDYRGATNLVSFAANIQPISSRP